MGEIIGGKVKIFVTLKVEVVKDSDACIQSKTGIEVELDDIMDGFQWLAERSIQNIKSKPGFTITNKARTVAIIETEYLGKKNENKSGFTFAETENALKEIAKEYKEMVSPGIIVPVGS